MVPSPRGGRVNLARPPSIGGLVYDSHELHACDLCLPIPASADLGGGCIELILGRARCLCIPTNEDPEQGDQQSNSALLQDTAGGSSLAKATVVRGGTGPLLRAAVGTSLSQEAPRIPQSDVFHQNRWIFKLHVWLLLNRLI